MLFPKSNCAYIPHMKSVGPRVCLTIVALLACFGPDMKSEVGVVI